MMLLCIILSVSWTALTSAAPLQKLEPMPGYVPVYIREGDIALNDINPELAEAFHEDKLSKISREENKSVKQIKNQREENVENFQATDELKNREKELNAREYAEFIITEAIEERKSHKKEDIATSEVIKSTEAKLSESLIKEN
uniref:Uncharacterized protein n=1 Tax=Glossina palpalis gambiensis TaxID=67801 RepID=A0A1B0BFP6_9MUSC